MKKILYFAYGSNLNIEQMKRRCPDSVGISAAELSDYKLVERTYADIEVAAGECVHGALYQISERDLANLDHYEGYPDYYTRDEVLVIDNAGVFHKSWVYIMTDECGKHRDHGKYSDRYRKICSDGAEYWGIPNAFSADKDERPCSLWTNGVPDIAEGLQKMFNILDSNSPLPRAKRLWCGARVVVTLKLQNIEGDFGFYPAPYEVSTPHALEVSWVFNDLRDLFKEKLNSVNKFYFFGEIASAASRAIESDPQISAADLCRKMVQKAQEILPEL